MGRKPQGTNNKAWKTIWKIALYIRLSKEDGRETSYSVQNQQEALDRYLTTFEDEFILADTYIDDGYTGINSDRQDFQRLLRDVESGRVNCVIVKDLSRLSRNNREAGYYLEEYFVKYDVRFISLYLPTLDSYKYPEQMNSLLVPFQNIINEDFCRQTSLKTRATLNTKRANGEFIGSFAPYGYRKSPNDKHKLIVDEEVAQTVRDIFNWFVNDGMSKRGIVRKLTALGVPCPSKHKKSIYAKYSTSHEHLNDINWSASSLKLILTSHVYIGHMVQGKQRVKSYKVKEQIRPPKEEWFIVENTHEPIISQDMFDKAQEILSRNTRTAPTKTTLNLFSGFVRCSDCGRTFHRKASKNNVYLFCRQYGHTGKCTKRATREDFLEKVVLEAISSQIALTFDLSKTIERINKMSSVKNQSKRLDDMLSKQQNELKKVLNASGSLYMDWKNGDITQDEYKHLKQNFTDKTEQLKLSIQAVERERAEMAAGINSSDGYFEQFAKYENITELTREILVELIDVILIHDDKQITIRFKFADQYQQILDFIESNEPKEAV